MSKLLYVLACIFTLLGGYMAYSGFTMDTNVYTPEPVANMQLLFWQLGFLIMATGCFATAGACLAGGAIVERLTPPE